MGPLRSSDLFVSSGVQWLLSREQNMSGGVTQVLPGWRFVCATALGGSNALVSAGYFLTSKFLPWVCLAGISQYQ